MPARAAADPTPALPSPAPHTVEHHDAPPPAGRCQLPQLPKVDYIRTDIIDTLPQKPPTRGVRRLLYRATAGKINPGQSGAEKRRHDLHRQARTLLRGNYRIGVVGKGGVGKTTIAACVGSTLARLRHDDLVVAIDADTGFGKLGSRIDPQAVNAYYELVTDQHLNEFPDMRSLVGANQDGLYVLPRDTQHRLPLTADLYHEALARLDRFFAITIVDCGATMDAPVTRAIAADLDAAIVVTTPWADGASTAHQSLQWLTEYGSANLAHRTIVILNDSDGNADQKTRAAIAHSFSSTGTPVFEVPFDRRLRPGGLIDLTRGMSPTTRQRFVEIAAALASRFGTTQHYQHAAQHGGIHVPGNAR